MGCGSARVVLDALVVATASLRRAIKLATVSGGDGFSEASVLPLQSEWPQLQLWTMPRNDWAECFDVIFFASIPMLPLSEHPVWRGRGKERLIIRAILLRS